MSTSGFDLRLTVFSPEGRIYQLEYALKAVESAPITAVALVGPDAAVIAVQKDVSDKLVVKESLTSIYRISDTVSCVAIGIEGDGRDMVRIARDEASDWEGRFGEPMPVYLLAHRLGSINQARTQSAKQRVVGSSLLLISCSDAKGPEVVKVDPAGCVENMCCCGLGKKHKEVKTFLDKNFKEGTELNVGELIKMSISALKEVLGSKPEAGDLEVICAQKETPPGRILKDSELVIILSEL